MSLLINNNNIIVNQDLMWWYDVGRRGGYGPNNSLIDLTGRGQNLNWYFGGGTIPNISQGFIDLTGAAAGNYAYHYNMLDRNILDCTFTIWFKTNNDSVFQPMKLAVERNDVANHIKLSFNDGRAIYNFYNGTGANNAIAGALTSSIGLYTDGNWKQYTLIRRSGSTPRWYHYINGVLITEPTIESGVTDSILSPSSAAGNVWLETYGARDYLGSFFAYKRALTDQQVLYNYNAYKDKYQ